MLNILHKKTLLIIIIVTIDLKNQNENTEGAVWQYIFLFFTSNNLLIAFSFTLNNFVIVVFMIFAIIYAKLNSFPFVFLWWFIIIFIVENIFWYFCYFIIKKKKLINK